jgi:GTP cyclohydrolase I
MGELKDYYTGEVSKVKDTITKPTKIETPVTYQSVSDKIIKRMKDANARFFANDNISKYMDDGDLELLVDEVEEKADAFLRSLCIDVDNDPNSKGTARRLSKMYLRELMAGRYLPAPEVTAFPNDGSHGTQPYNGMLVVRAELKSMCSHHHQPVTGTAYIGIIPTTKVIGLSKYVRIAQHCARRGTLQEELCGDIAQAIMDATNSENVAVHIAAEHGCCTNRGIMASSSLTQTTVLHGMFYISSIKDEFFQNIRLQSSQNKYSCL